MAEKPTVSEVVSPKKLRLKTYPFPWKRGSNAEKVFEKYQKEIREIGSGNLTDANIKAYETKIDNAVAEIWENIPKGSKKRTGRNRAVLRASLFYELYVKARKSWSVSNTIKEELYKKATEPTRKEVTQPRKEQEDELSESLLAKAEPETKPSAPKKPKKRGIIDPVFDYDPSLDASENIVSSLDLKAETIDARLSRKIDELMNIEIPPNTKLNPLQIFLLELLNAHVLEPILQNIQVLTTKRIPLKGSTTDRIVKGFGFMGGLVGTLMSLDEEIALGISYLLRRLVKNFGAIIMKHPSIYSYDELAKTVLEMERVWNRTLGGTMMKAALKLSPRRAAAHLGVSLGKRMEGIKEKPIRWDLVRSTLDLIQPLLPYLHNLYKRNPEEVAEIRENYRIHSPERMRNMKVLLRFLNEIAGKKGIARDSKFLINFVMRTVALMDSDQELAVFGRKTLPLVRYLAMRPDMGGELKKSIGLKEEEELKVSQLHQIIFPEYMKLEGIPENFKNFRNLIEEKIIELRNLKKLPQETFLAIQMALNRLEVMFAKNEDSEKITDLCINLIAIGGGSKEFRKEVEPEIKLFVERVKSEKKAQA